MKIRNGFVSNSSSANFIIEWKERDDGEDVEVSIDRLNFIIDNLFWEDAIRKVLKDNTVINNKEHYVSTFWTSMYNDVSDVKEGAMLLAGLTAGYNMKFDVLKTEVEND